MSAVDRHSRLAEVFEGARELPADRRDVYLIDACGGDDGLLTEVRSLLRHHECADDSAVALEQPILARPVSMGAMLSSAGEHDPTAGANVEIPGYRIVKELGQGGMGMVLLAEQHKPRRPVAIKLMRPGLVSPGLLRRFDLEQELLARLQHPGIAQIYGAGVCRPFGESGPSQPYFAMEFVQGEPLDEYCRRHGLNTRERLRLLMQICEAVQHAHVMGVVHRDLKPGNILVSQLSDGSAAHSRPITKILDFGVARATGSDIQLTTINTAVGQLVGTLAYMSPEQASGDGSMVDGRADVYALGVIGYELLTGRTPHALAGKNIAEAARSIRDDDPHPLSVLNRVFRGDLDTILAKALEKEPARRYASAAELAADIDRFLSDQPIVARPASTVYNLQKFARRNKGLVAGVATAFIILAAGVVGTTMAMLEAQVQRDEATTAKDAADREAETAKAVTRFLQEMLGAPDPLARTNAVNDDPKQTRIIDMLDNAAELAAERFAEQPIVEADVCTVLARTYSHLAEFDKAEPLLRRALEIYERDLGAADRRTIDVVGALGTLFMLQHRFDEARTFKERELERSRAELGPAHKDTLGALEQLGLMYTTMADYDRALDVFNELLATRQETLGPEHEDTINTKYNVSWVHAKAGRYDVALPLSEELYAVAQRVFGPDDARTISFLNNIAYLYERLDRVEDALRLHAANVAHGRTALPPTDWRLGVYLHNQASALRKLERYAEAEPLELEAIALFEKNFDRDSRRYRTAIDGVIALYDAWGKPEEAARWRQRLSKEPATAASTEPAGLP